MNEHKKKKLFELAYKAEQSRNEADPNDERDLWYFGYNEALEDALCDLGLTEEYNDWKGAK